jgi:Protein of unknown function (DUF1214)
MFWQVTLYEAENASGLDNGQPFPSLGKLLGKLDKPAENPDESTDLTIGPRAPQGKEGEWLATAPGRGVCAILRLYAPEQPALDGSWKPGDMEKARVERTGRKSPRRLMILRIVDIFLRGAEIRGTVFNTDQLDRPAGLKAWSGRCWRWTRKGRHGPVARNLNRRRESF